MLEILQYIFSSFWIFCGTIILLYTIGIFCIIAPISAIASIFIKEEKKEEKNNKMCVSRKENAIGRSN